MKSKIFALVVMLAIMSSAHSQDNRDIIISEYCEYDHTASSPRYYNHYIELCNTSDDPIDLSAYQLWRAMNGGGWNSDEGTPVDPLTLKGVLLPGETYLITRPDTEDNPTTIDALQDTTWSFLNISGDDAIGLAKNNGEGTYVLSDLIGDPDLDPGTAWEVSGIERATFNHTLIRMPDVCQPTTDWEESAGTNTENSQWLVLPKNNMDDIGTHSYTCSSEFGDINMVSALFVGNSYTYYNDLPDMVQNLAMSVGDRLIQDSYTVGGYTLEEHLENINTIRKIKKGYWDYMVLQEQSTRPIRDIETVEEQTFAKAHALDSIRNLYSPIGQTMFYMTWGRRDGHDGLCPTIPEACTFDDMNSLLRLRYRMMQENENAAISPVGATWKYIRDNHPEIELYDSDGSHPSQAGSYVSACSFYTAIFKKDPTLLSYDFTLSAEIAEIIRSAAKAVVFDSLSYWNTYTPMRDLSISVSFDSISNNESFYPDSNISLSVTVENGGEEIASVVYLINGEALDTLYEAPFNKYVNFAETGDYTLIAIATNLEGNSNYTKIDINIVEPASVITYDDNLPNINIYPNPATSMLYIDINENSEPAIATIFNNLGQVIQKSELNSGVNVISLHNFEPGIFYIKVIAGSETAMVKKFIKN